MKTPLRLIVLAGFASASLFAQQPPPPPPMGPDGEGHRPPPPPPSPLAVAIDANHDGVISAEEITNAPAALKTLDKNGDGQLTREEFSPPPPPRRHHGGPDSPKEDSPSTPKSPAPPQN